MIDISESTTVTEIDGCRELISLMALDRGNAFVIIPISYSLCMYDIIHTVPYIIIKAKMSVKTRAIPYMKTEYELSFDERVYQQVIALKSQSLMNLSCQNL